MNLANKKILVVGLGTTGLAVTRFLTKAGAAVTVTDIMMMRFDIFQQTQFFHFLNDLITPYKPVGAGKWTGISSLEMGIPLTLIGEAVYARCLSAMKDPDVEGVDQSFGARMPTLRSE